RPRTLFFRQSSAHLRALHSFPTRRSSDLICNRRSPLAIRGNTPFSRPNWRTTFLWPSIEGGPQESCPRSRRVSAITPTLAMWTRSEEHTSELQSLTNLVCRLLLEKEKKSTVSNLLSGATAAEANPQAGFTRHPIAYTSAYGPLDWTAHARLLGPLQPLTQALPSRR